MMRRIINRKMKYQHKQKRNILSSFLSTLIVLLHSISNYIPLCTSFSSPTIKINNNRRLVAPLPSISDNFNVFHSIAFCSKRHSCILQFNKRHLYTTNSNAITNNKNIQNSHIVKVLSMTTNDDNTFIPTDEIIHSNTNQQTKDNNQSTNAFSVLPPLRFNSSSSSSSLLSNNYNYSKQVNTVFTTKYSKRDSKSQTSTSTSNLMVPTIPTSIPKLSQILYKQTTIQNNNSNSTLSSSSSESWKAGYMTSLQTQKRILAAAAVTTTTSSNSTNPIQHAISVFETLFNTPPHQCNESNLLCTLIQSTKILSSHNSLANNNNKDSDDDLQQQQMEKLQNYIFQSLDILHLLVSQRQLNTRQLANASWVIGKLFTLSSSRSHHHHHHNYDNQRRKRRRRQDYDSPQIHHHQQQRQTQLLEFQLLPDSFYNSIQNDECIYNYSPSSQTNSQDRKGSTGNPTRKQSISLAEKWTLRNEYSNNNNSEITTNQTENIHLQRQQQQQRVLETLCMIASQFMNAITTTSNTSDLSTSKNETTNHQNSSSSSFSPSWAPPKPMEISMICWSFATIQPRRCPPGWELPPRSIQYDSRANNVSSKTYKHGRENQYVRNDDDDNDGDNDDIVTFQQMETINSNNKEASKWFQTNNNNSNNQNDEQNDLESIISQLFDVIAQFLTTITPNITQQINTDNSHDEKGQNTNRLQEYKWQEISTITWAYANYGHYETNASKDLINSIVQDATERLKRYDISDDHNNMDRRRKDCYSPRDIASIAWSLGTIQSDNFQLSDALVDFMDAVSQTFMNAVKKRNRNEIMEGSSSSDSSNNDDRTYRPLADWQSADLVQIAVSLAHGRIDNMELLKYVFYEAAHSILIEIGALYDSSEIVSSALDSDKSKNENDVVTDNENDVSSWKKSTAENVQRKKFQSWELVALLWVQARLHLTETQGSVFNLFSDILPTVLLYRMNIQKKRQEKNSSGNDNKDDANVLTKYDFESIGLQAQEQANLAWSFTILEKYKSPDAIRLLQNIFRVSSDAACVDGDIIRLEHAHQLWQSICILQDECPECCYNSSSSTNIASDEYMKFLHDVWRVEKTRIKTSSARHYALSKTLDLMGVAHYNEHDEDIDVAIVLKTDSVWTHTADKSLDDSDFQHRKVAVEFDGPNHFTRIRNKKMVKSPTPRALGHTILKYRLLKNQGWTVVRVPYYEFDKIPYWASMERQRYLQRLLKTHANISFSRVDKSEYKPQVSNRLSRFD